MNLRTPKSFTRTKLALITVAVAVVLVLFFAWSYLRATPPLLGVRSVDPRLTSRFALLTFGETHSNGVWHTLNTTHDYSRLLSESRVAFDQRMEVWMHRLKVLDRSPAAQMKRANTRHRNSSVVTDSQKPVLWISFQGNIDARELFNASLLKNGVRHPLKIEIAYGSTRGNFLSSWSLATNIPSGTYEFALNKGNKIFELEINDASVRAR